MQVERAMQLCVNSVQKWISKNGFRFSPSKTACFVDRTVFFPEPTILLNKSPIKLKVVKEAKVLGLIFDFKLIFKKPHTASKNIMSKSTGYPTCSRTHRFESWPYSPPSLLPVFGSFQTGLRFHCLWVGFKVTPKTIGSDPSSRSLYSVGSIPCSEFVLYVEAHEPSLSSRRLILSLNYVIKLNS